MYHHFVDIDISNIDGDVKKWCNKHANSEYLIREDTFKHMYVVRRIYFASKKDADKFREEFDNSLYRTPLAEIHHEGTILKMMEKNAQNWEDEGNLRMAEEIREQIKGKFFQNFARKQIKDREENGKKGKGKKG